MGLFKGLKKVGGFVGKNIVSPVVKNTVPGGKSIISVVNKVGKDLGKAKGGAPPRELVKGGVTGQAKQLSQKLLGGVSGSVNFGNESSKGFIPVIIAIGVVLFGLFSFGGLFRKPSRRRRR